MFTHHLMDHYQSGIGLSLLQTNILFIILSLFKVQLTWALIHFASYLLPG